MGLVGVSLENFVAEPPLKGNGNESLLWKDDGGTTGWRNQRVNAAT